MGAYLGRTGVLLGRTWLEDWSSLSSPLEGCGVVWGWMLWGVGNLSRDFPLLVRDCLKIPPVFLLWTCW